MRRPAAIALAVLAALAPACGPGRPPEIPPGASHEPPPPAAHSPGPKVVVTLVVDQLAAWVLSERAPLLPEDGGFARLRREGTYVREVRHGHAATDTAPGHAALYTGGSPHRSGIFGNEIVDPKAHKRVSILADAQTRLVGPGGPLEAQGSSPAMLRADTVADRLRKARPEAFIASLSLKDRGAIFGGGRSPDAAVWFDNGADAFVTSTAFAKALPSWAVAEGDHAAVERQRQQAWTLLKPAWVKEHARTPDDQPGEGDVTGFGVVFPHDFGRTTRKPLAFRASPMADERLVALALAASRDPRFGKAPTLLAVSLSSNDYVGHVFGPDSWEAWDELARLDAQLARLFSGLDASVGPEGWAALLSADHGTTPMPETAMVPGARPWCQGATPDRWARPCEGGGRLYMDGMAQALEAAARRELGAGEWVKGVADPWVYLSDQAKALEPGRASALMSVLRAELTKSPLVARVFESSTLPQPCPPTTDESVEALVCRSFAPGAGELYVVAKPGSFFDPDYVVGKGTSHGSPYLNDRTVPLLVRAPGRAQAGLVIDEPLHASAFAHTACSLLGVEPPEPAAEGRDLAPPKG